MSKGNRVLAIKHAKAKRERQAFAAIEYSKPAYLVPKVRIAEWCDRAARVIDGKAVRVIPEGMTRADHRRELRSHF